MLPQLPVIQLEFATATLIYPSIYSSSTKYAPIHSCERLDTGNSLFFIKFRIRLIGLLGFQWAYFHIRISNSIILIRVRSTPAILAGVRAPLSRTSGATGVRRSRTSGATRFELDSNLQP